MSSTLASLGLPEPESPKSEMLGALGLPEPDGPPRLDRLPKRFKSPFEGTPELRRFLAEAQAQRDQPIVPEYPIEAAASVIPGFKAATAAGAALKTVPWLVRSAASGAAAGATAGGISESGKGPVEAAKGAALGGLAGAVLSPPLEAFGGQAGKVLEGLFRRTPKPAAVVPGKPPISPVEPVETMPVAKVPPEAPAAPVAKGVPVEAPAPTATVAAEPGQKFTLQNDVYNFQHGQMDARIVARDEAGNVVGYLDYSVYQNKPHIKMVEVSPNVRGQGIGKKLVAELENESGKNGWKGLDWGYQTEEGQALRVAYYREKAGLPPRALSANAAPEPALPGPRAPVTPPEPQPVTAILTRDGRILTDPTARTHAQAVENLGIDPADVADGGFMVGDRYAPGSADAAAIGERAAAAKRVAERRASRVPPPQPVTTANAQQTLTRTGPNSGPTVPQKVDLSKIGLPVEGELPGGAPEMVPVEKALASLGLGTRKVRTFADMKAAAEELGMDHATLLKGAAARPISDAEVVASANLINDAATLHTQAVAKLADPALTDAERVTAQQQANAAMHVIERALKRRIKGGTEAGRAVAAYRIIGNRTLDPAYWYSAAKRELSRGGEQPFTEELKGAIDGAIASGDRLTLARIVSHLRKPGAAETITTLARAFMLSNPGTDVRNVAGNLSFNIANGVADLPATALDYLMSRATGIRTKALPSATQIAETAKGVVSGVKKAGEVLKYGDTEEQALAKYDFGHDVHFDNKALEFFTQSVFRRLGAEDYLFREPAKFRAIAELAEVTAKNEGLRGDAFLARVRDLIKAPTDQMKAVATADAEYRTFNQPSALAEWMSSLERKGPGYRIVGTMVAPFKRTPVNIAKAIVDFSPFGMPKAALKYASQKGGDQFLRQRYFVEGMGRSVTGTSIAGLGYWLYRKGLATGAPPSDPEAKRLRRAQGIPDYAINVQGQWVGINNNAPLSNILMLGVDAAQQFDEDKSLDKKIAGAAFSGVRGLSEQTFLKGVRQTTEAAYDPGRYGGSVLEGFAGMLVPSIVGAVARGSDPLERRVEGPGEAVMAKVPGLREKLEPQIDVHGKERKQRAGVLSQMFSPVRPTPADTSLTGRAMKHAGWAPTEARPSVDKKVPKSQRKELSNRELTEFQREMNQARDEAMRRVASQPNFFNRDQDQAKDLLEDAANRAARQVRERWKRRKPANTGRQK